jgi:hypothetical protein
MRQESQPEFWLRREREERSLAIKTSGEIRIAHTKMADQFWELSYQEASDVGKHVVDWRARCDRDWTAR